MEAAEDVVDGPPLRVVEVPAGQLLRHRVEVLDVQVRIGRDHAVADRLQRDLRALLLAEERVLVELALGDVELDTDQPLEPAARVRARLGAAHDPAPLAVAVTHAVHALEHRGLTRDVLADHRLHTAHVVGMDEPAPVGRDLGVVLVEAEHVAPAWREVHGVVVDVEVPETIVRRMQRQRGALLETAEMTLDAQPLQAGRKARADELQEQVQIGIPAIARLRRAEGHEPVHPVAQRKAADEQRTHVELGEACRVSAPARGAADRCRGSRRCADDRGPRPATGSAPARRPS